MKQPNWLISLMTALCFWAVTLLLLNYPAVAAVGQGHSYFVAPDGDDNNPGTAAEPWATIQHAADTLAPGDTVYVQSGTYNEAVSLNVSGSADGGYVTLQNASGAIPILDGTSLAHPDGDNAIYIHSQSYLIIQGFEIRNYTTSLPDIVPMGIQVEGAAHHIQLLNNHIHHIETNAPVDRDLLGADAHGIAVYGTETQPIHHLTISGNELDHLKLGSSEALALNGNVEHFTVTHNLVHDTDNIAIVCIGFEETAATPMLDRARNGVVISNTVYNVDSATNPAYGGGESGGGDRSAGGIYVDGGRNILIEHNRVYSANIGIEVASEHANGNASYITVTNNLIYHSHVAGIALGGYATDRGYAANCSIVNNTLYHNDSIHSGSAELMLQYDIRDNIIKNNIFYANEQSTLISNVYTQNSGNLVDYNLYYAPAGAVDSEWMWKNESYTGFAAYRSGTGNDAHSIFTNPLFIDAVKPDLHLLSMSPAINKGATVAVVSQYDIDGEVRIQANVVDIGADEYASMLRVYLPIILKGFTR